MKKATVMGCANAVISRLTQEEIDNHAFGNKNMTDEIQQLAGACNKKGFDFYVEGEQIHITSKHDRWIIMNDPKNGKPNLYHRNKSLSTCSPDSPIWFYHLQSQAPHTYRSILKYIVNHDKYANHSVVVQTKYPPEKNRKREWSRKNQCSAAERSYPKEKEGNKKQRKIECESIKEMILDSVYDGE